MALALVFFRLAEKALQFAFARRHTFDLGTVAGTAANSMLKAQVFGIPIATTQPKNGWNICRLMVGGRMTSTCGYKMKCLFSGIICSSSHLFLSFVLYICISKFGCSN